MNNLENLMKTGKGVIKNTDNIVKLLIVFIVLGCGNYILAYKTKEPHVYTYLSETEKLQGKVNTLPIPVLNHETLTNNVDQALFDTFNFDASNYTTKLPNALGKWYTPQGAEDVFNNITNLNNGNGSFIDFMFQNRITSQAYVLPGTSVIRTTILNNRTAWHIGARMLLTYRNQFGYSSSNIVDVSVWVVVIPPSENPNAIGIRSIRLI
jgi:hypothetical protein